MKQKWISLMALLLCAALLLPTMAAATDGGASLLDAGYVQCDDCGGWYMSGNDFRNHICTHEPANLSSSWTSKDE